MLTDVNFTKILAMTAIYSSNRKRLFQLIHAPIERKIKSINKSAHLFEEWLKDSSLVNLKTSSKNQIKETIKESTKDNDDLTTETLAKIYINQGHYQRAIQAYEILCLKYPKKSAFFANQIKNIKNNLN